MSSLLSPTRAIRVFLFTFTGLAALAWLAGSALAGTASAAPSPAKLPPVKHVFVIVLENEGYSATFGNPSAYPYLARTLPQKGALLTQYYAIGHASNDNYVAMISGQPPNPSNQADCQRFANFPLARLANGVEPGSGCVYPSNVGNITTQLSGKGLTWKGYMQDMGNVHIRESTTCGHPTVGSLDYTQSALPEDGYVTRHDPFVYFHSIIDRRSYCDAHVVPLGATDGKMPARTPKGVTGLATDLKAVATTPNFSFVTPNVCNDGHDYPCVNQASDVSAAENVDGFLAAWVPKILGSPAYKKDGLLEITFDESDIGDSAACCGERPGPTGSQPGLSGPGGGRIGAILLSPFIRPGTKSNVTYNHYSSLATWESLFGLPRLAYAATAPQTFGSDVFAVLGTKRSH